MVVDDVVDGGVGLGVVVGEGRPDVRKVGGEQVCWESDIISRRGGGSVIITIITIDERKVDFLRLQNMHTAAYEKAKPACSTSSRVVLTKTALTGCRLRDPSRYTDT